MNTILQGDALTVLKTLPDNLVQTVVTSPPYFSLRDYGVPGQIGLEATPEEFIEKLVEVFREVKRVLRHDGTLWVNMGDSYAGSGKGAGGKQEYLHRGIPSGGYTSDKLKPKNLMGMPWKLAFALQADGWNLRSEIIWHKPTAMPESVTDRPTKAHEHIFLLSKNERYFYDGQAIAESYSETSHGGNISRGGQKQIELGRNVRSSTLGPTALQSGRTTRNKRTVWTIASQPYSEAHFATFPPKLIEPCILAGTSPRACELCGTPWERVTEREETPDHIKAQFEASRKRTSENTGRTDGHTNYKPHYTRAILGEHMHPTCRCDNTGSGKCIVLDPFIGSGTTALVALRHGRQYLGIELNPAYIALAEKRIAYVQQNLWDVAWMESEAAV